eukprot:gene5369-6040_t
MLEQLQNLDPKKGSPQNAIPAKILKYNADLFCFPLTELFNKLVEESSFPDNMKNADVSSLFKKDDNMSKKNYRPISLLPTIENSDQAKEACKKKSNNENKMQNSGALQESHLEKEEINHWETGILKNLEIIANAKMLKKKKQINAEEWKLAAATLDRICGVIFASTMMFTLAYIFLAAPRVNL